jgi:PKD repeat protein
MTARRLATVVAVSLVLTAAGAGVPAAAAQATDGIRVSPETAAVGEAITFSAPGVDAAAYEWDFGDETVTPSGQTATHEYLEPGEYTVTLEARTDGETTTYETTVTVEPRFANVTQVDPETTIETSGDPGDTGADVDVYAVTVPPEHHLGVSGTSTAFGVDDLRVYDADGRQVAGASLGPDAILVGTTAPSASETYYVAAQQGNDYRRLSLAVLQPDGFEPNQGPSTAERLGADDERSGVVSQADRVDWFAVDAGSGTLAATVELDGVSANQPNVAVELYDATGTQIGDLGPAARDGNRTAANGADADYTAVQRAEIPDEGTYYVRVRAVNESSSFVDGFDSAPRAYTLTVDAPSAGPPAVVASGASPTDPDDDGRYEDVNGDGSVDVLDVQTLFASLESDEVQDNPRAFDFDGDGTVSVVDIQALFAESGDG